MQVGAEKHRGGRWIGNNRSSPLCLLHILKIQIDSRSFLG
ncbi:hypothetical protein SLEP1_g2895 [Rubroshorea leprosula]|uniref:Ycf15 n=1 Tax=Rubroshorea leprosula TaxID=152421 RepID=A0AAV5HIN3_9ROSI|nr:hypothetical protein SLEP1_g2895 [Rubroshorea leprosula]